MKLLISAQPKKQTQSNPFFKRQLYRTNLSPTPDHEPKNEKRNQFSKDKNEHKLSFNKELRKRQPGRPGQNKTNLACPVIPASAEIQFFNFPLWLCTFYFNL
jgi:hypothetical protein